MLLFFFLGQIGPNGDKDDPICGEDIERDADNPPIPFQEIRNLKSDENDA
jgi:hypothetical protein